MKTRTSKPTTRSSGRRLRPIPPPKSVEELAKEQGVWGKKFDYVALATAVWPTMKDVREFEQHLREARREGVE